MPGTEDPKKVAWLTRFGVSALAAAPGPGKPILARGDATGADGADGGYDGGGSDGGTDGGGYDGGGFDGGTDGGTNGGTDGGTGGGTDGGTDGGYDGGTDGGTDGGYGGGTDGRTGGGYDAGTDGGTDGGSDAGTDGGTDGGYDGGTDGGTDGGHDGGTDGGTDGYNPPPNPSVLTATAADIFFDVDSSELTPSDRTSLDAYAAAMASGSEQITVNGYDSVDGTAQRNNQLANARSQAVVSYLVGKGIAAKRIKAAGRGPTDSFSKTDAAANRRVTLAPKPAAPPKPPPKYKPLTLEHETEATSPSDRKRTKLGVGERVTLTASRSGTWEVKNGKLSATSGAKVVFTAPSTVNHATITVRAGGEEQKVEFDVIAPSSVHMDVNGRRHIANGQPNAGFHAEIYIGPADVSFKNIEFLERDVGAVANGHWASFNGVGHHPGKAWGTMQDVVASGKGTKSNFMDNCLSGETGTGKPWKGSYSFSIPWLYRVGSGGGTQFTTVVQTVTTGDDGTTTISKAGASTTFRIADGAATYPGALY
jgi:hypothetical protein